MAFYINDEEENLDPNAAPSAPQTGQSGTIAGQGAAPSAAGPSKTPDNPGNFVGIKQYLDANKNQSAKLGDQVAGNIQTSIQGASDEIGGVGDKFKQKADAGTISNLGTAQADAQNVVSQAATGNVPLAQDQTNRFKEVSTAEYKGPKALIDSDIYQPAYQKMKQAQSYADLSKTESGNQQLLKEMYKDPSYTAGANRFDSYLLNSDDAKLKLENSRANAGSLQGAFDAADTGASAYATQIAEQTDAAKNAARQGLESTRGTRTNEVQSELDKVQWGADGLQGTADDATTGWNSEYNQYLNLLNNSDNGNNLALNDEQMQKLGVEGDQRIYNLLDGSNGKDFLTMQAFDANKVISKDQQMQLAALDDLANQYGGKQTNKYTQGDLAGTMDKTLAFAADKFGLAADEQQKMFDATVKIKNIASEMATDGQVLNEEQLKQITRSITRHLPWPLSSIVEWVTDTVATNVAVGYAGLQTTAQGTVGQYLQGQGPQFNDGDKVNVDWGVALAPQNIQGQGERAIERMRPGTHTTTQADWTAKILEELQRSGYNKQIKKG